MRVPQRFRAAGCDVSWIDVDDCAYARLQIDSLSFLQGQVPAPLYDWRVQTTPPKIDNR